MNRVRLEDDCIVVSSVIGNKMYNEYIQKGKVVFRLNYTYDEPKNEEEAKHNQDCVDHAYDLLFDEVAKNMKDEFPWLKRYVGDK